MAMTRMHVNSYPSLLDDVLGLHSTSLDVSQGQGFRCPRHKNGQAESGDGSTDAGGKPFTPLERFVMELFRTITPNGGSISPLAEVRTPPYERHGYVATPHETTSFDPVQPCRVPNGLARSIRDQWGPERNAFAGLVSELTEVAGPAFFFMHSWGAFKSVGR
jgi:hypothetical protein